MCSESGDATKVEVRCSEGGVDLPKSCLWRFAKGVQTWLRKKETRRLRMKMKGNLGFKIL